MRIRLPFTGTLLKSYEPGTVPTFDPADPMYPIDDVLGPHGYTVLLDTFDFNEGTVEVDVTIEESQISDSMKDRSTADLRAASSRGGSFTDSRGLVSDV